MSDPPQNIGFLPGIALVLGASLDKPLEESIIIIDCSVSLWRESHIFSKNRGKCSRDFRVATRCFPLAEGTPDGRTPLAEHTHLVCPKHLAVGVACIRMRAHGVETLATEPFPRNIERIQKPREKRR